MSTFVLDLIPSEVVYTIFNYLWCDEILYSFLNITNSFNNIIFNYENYHINFKSILKRQFDLICRYIRSNQIRSLILSDSNETPNQSKIFLTLFPIEQFINLRAITLCNINNESHSLFQNINQLKYLHSFQTDTFSHLWMIESTPKLKQLIINKFIDTDYNHLDYLSSISLSYLSKLTLSYCSYVQLRRILSSAPKLISLNISLIISDCTGIDYFAEQHQDSPLSIRDLTMSIHTFTRTISRLLFERFLARTPHLQQLELIISSGGSSNLLEGKQWEIFITKYLLNLSIFNFKFKIINIDRQIYNENNVLIPFRSPFWMNQHPRWYVAYNINDLILYSVPYFAPRMIKHSLFSHLPHFTTLPIEEYFYYYDQINELELDSNDKSSYRYTHIQRLILSIGTINKDLIDLSKVEYLCVKSSLWSWKKLIPIIKNSMPRLSHLKIDCNLSVIQSSDIIPLTQIRILDISEISLNNEIDLSSLFPSIERLIIAIENLHQILHLIDRFTQLSSGSFHIINNQNHTFISKWLIEETNRNHFTYRLDFQPDIWIHTWINSEHKQPIIKLKDKELKTNHSGCCSLQ